MNNEIRKLIDAGNHLAFCAETSGGTAGRDETLISAIGKWIQARMEVLAIASIHKFEPEDTVIEAGAAHTEPGLRLAIEAVRTLLQPDRFHRPFENRIAVEAIRAELATLPGDDPYNRGYEAGMKAGMAIVSRETDIYDKMLKDAYGEDWLNNCREKG